MSCNLKFQSRVLKSKERYSHWNIVKPQKPTKYFEGRKAAQKESGECNLVPFSGAKRLIDYFSVEAV